MMGLLNQPGMMLHQLLLRPMGHAGVEAMTQAAAMQGAADGDVNGSALLSASCEAECWPGAAAAAPGNGASASAVAACNAPADAPPMQGHATRHRSQLGRGMQAAVQLLQARIYANVHHAQRCDHWVSCDSDGPAQAVNLYAESVDHIPCKEMPLQHCQKTSSSQLPQVPSQLLPVASHMLAEQIHTCRISADPVPADLSMHGNTISMHGAAASTEAATSSVMPALAGAGSAPALSALAATTALCIRAAVPAMASTVEAAAVVLEAPQAVTNPYLPAVLEAPLGAPLEVSSVRLPYGLNGDTFAGKQTHVW